MIERRNHGSILHSSCDIAALRKPQRSVALSDEWKPYHPTAKEIAEAAARRRVGEHSGRDNGWLAQAYLDLIDNKNQE